MKTVGKQLQEARLSKEWSPELAARETKIKVERLRDLEADDYANFSSPTYARGFVRTYARSLGLDEYKLLRQLDNKLPEDDNASFANDSGVPYIPEPSQASRSYRFGTGVYVAMGTGAIVLLLIAFILFESYRAGYFAQALPPAPPAAVTNAAPLPSETEPVARALPADSNAAPVALPVDLTAGPVAAGTNGAPMVAPTATAAETADATTNAPPAVASAPAPVSTTPLDTKTPPRALPVDLSALAATPSSAPATNVAAASVPIVPSTETPAAAPSVSPAPVYHPPPSLSARGADARPLPAPAVSPATPPASAPATSVRLVTAVSADPPPSEATPATPDTVAVATPVTPSSATPDTEAAPAMASEPPAVPAATPDTVAVPVGANDSSAPVQVTPAPAETHAGKRLVLTASRDSYIRVVSLDDPYGEQVRYSSVLHEGQSISFNDRKYSINVGVPSAVDILLDGINYGPHSDHSEPDTFTVESHQP